MTAALCTAIVATAASASTSAAGFASLVVEPPDLVAGDQGMLAIHVKRPANCILNFASGKTRIGPFAVRAQAYAEWTWLVPPDVRQQAWTLTVVCTASARTQRLVSLVNTIGVTGGKEAIVWRDSMMQRALVTPPAKPGGSLGTRDDAGVAYPDAAAPCSSSPFGTTGPCKPNAWGYRRSNGAWSLLSNRGFGYRSSTDYVAWATGLTWASFHFPTGRGAAGTWKTFAGGAGLQVAATPSVGDVAWWAATTGNRAGQVGVITGLAGDAAVVSEFDADGTGAFSSQTVHADAYLHRSTTVPAAPPAWSPGTAAVGAPPPPPTTGDTVAPALTTTSISSFGPDGPTSRTITWAPASDNVAVVGYLISIDGLLIGSVTATRYTLNNLTCDTPHVVSVAAYDPAGNTSPSATLSGVKATCIMKPLPFSSQEQATSRTATYRGYHDFSDLGPFIEAGQVVTVNCKLVDGGTTWYSILSPPWSGGYYAQASQFANSSDSALRSC